MTTRANGRELVPGTEVSIKGKRGRFRFVKESTTSEGKTVLDFVGGTTGHEQWHSFYPDRVKTVHRVNRTRANRKRGTE